MHGEEPVLVLTLEISWDYCGRSVDCVICVIIGVN